MRRAPCVRRQARTRTTGNAHKKRFIAENRGDLENDCVT
ncbi:conserved hypothetical protein [Burkholderia mallei ATCC 10399]|nr:conserved hypothetical protein [Burkholderia mallei ATCC 10399]